jgi:hypothetical protein
MKLQILSQSGKPSDPVKAMAYDNEWRLLYDKAESKASAIFQKPNNRLSTKPHMIILQRLLRYCEYKLNQQYADAEMVEVPKTAAQWNKLIELYQFPIMVVKRPSKGLALILMDSMAE